MSLHQANILLNNGVADLTIYCMFIANLLLRKFSRCSVEVKCYLFKTYPGNNLALIGIY